MAKSNGDKGPEVGIYLNRVLLVNWSLHSKVMYSPIGRDGATLIGSNGSGKSTLIDAITTVLMGSRHSKNYNQAAFEGSSGRNFEDYMLGRKPGTGSGGVREKRRFTTHIVLEFEDLLAGRFAFGLAADYEPTSTSPVRSDFYYHEGPVLEDLYETQGRASTRSELFGAFKAIGEEKRHEWYRVFHSAKDYKRAFCLRMGVDEGYLDSYAKLTAISKKVDLADFIFDNLCERSGRVSADNMNSLLNTWQQFEEEYDAACERKQKIEEEIAAFGKLSKARNELSVTQRACDLADAQKTERELKAAETALMRESDELERGERALEDAKAERTRVESELTALEAAVNADDGLRRQSELERERAQASRAYEEEQRIITETSSALARNIGELMEDRALEAMASLDPETRLPQLMRVCLDEGQGVFATEAAKLRSMIEAADDLSALVEDRIALLAIERRDAVTAVERAKEALASLDSGRGGFPAHVRRFMDYLRDEAGIEAMPLAGAIDLAPGAEAWRDVAEAELGGDRLSVIVSVRDFERAQKAYDRYRDRRECRLVASRKLMECARDYPAKSGSLAEKIVAGDGDLGQVAKAYVDFRLGTLMCTDDLERFMEEDPKGRAVTAEGRRYARFTRSWVRTDRARDHLIGEGARAAREREIGIEARKAIADAQADQVRLDDERGLLNNIKANLPSSVSAFAMALDSALRAQSRADEAAERIDGLSAAIDAIDTSSHAELKARAAELARRKTDLDNEVSEASRKLGSLECLVDQGRERIQGLTGRLVEARANSLPLGDEELEAHAAELSHKGAKALQSELEKAVGKCTAARDRLIAIRANNSIYVRSASIATDAEDNEVWEAELEQLRREIIPRTKALLAEVTEDTKRGFMTSIVSEIRNGIAGAHRAVEECNRQLKQLDFGVKKYHLSCTKTTGPLSAYHDMICDEDFVNGEGSGGLWEQRFYEKHRTEIDSFFDAIRISAVGKTEVERREAIEQRDRLLDIRNYLNFEMTQQDADGPATKLTEGLKACSGGEFLLPLYLILLVGLANKCKTSRHGREANTLRLAALDEAFHDIDAVSTAEGVSYMRQLGLQPIFATPSGDHAQIFIMGTGNFFNHAKVGMTFRVLRASDGDERLING